MTGFSDKQRDWFTHATRRYNFKLGAVRSGKTYADYFMIPKRIRALAGRDGHIFIIGRTRATVCRNIIEPLRGLWGAGLVGFPAGDGTVKLFGEVAFIMGADSVSRAELLRGASLKYCYGDEVTSWRREVFDMVLTRLDRAYSVFDGTANPASPRHFLKTFLERGNDDIYCQYYTLYDNPYNPPEFVSALEREFAGSVLFDRYILGRWTAAQGLIYRRFADNPTAFAVSAGEIPPLEHITVGVDFGGTRSNHAVVACGFHRDGVYVLRAASLCARDMTSSELCRRVKRFCDGIYARYGFIDGIYCDSAEQTLIATLRRSVPYSVYNARKLPVLERIRAESLLIAEGRLLLLEGECEALERGLSEAMWDSRAAGDVRLDDGTSDIDVLDAFEYGIEYYLPVGR